MMWQVVVCLDGCARAINDQGEMATGCWRFEPVPFPAADPSAKRRRGDSEVSHHVWAVLARIHPSAASVQPCIHASIHPCMHACLHPVGKAQANRFTDVCAKGYLNFNVNCLNCQGLPQIFLFFLIFQPGFVAFVASVASVAFVGVRLLWLYHAFPIYLPIYLI